MIGSALFSLALAGSAFAAVGTPLSLSAATYVKAHNAARAHYSASALTAVTDAAFVTDTQNWANACKFEHSGGKYGENLAAWGRSPASRSVDFETHAMKPWMAENTTYFDGGAGQTGHFTRVVWKSTTKVVCAVAHCPAGSVFPTMAGQFYVCRYSPGNYVGQESKNVGRYVDVADAPAVKDPATTTGATTTSESGTTIEPTTTKPLPTWTARKSKTPVPSPALLKSGSKEASAEKELVASAASSPCPSGKPSDVPVVPVRLFKGKSWDHKGHHHGKAHAYGRKWKLERVQRKKQHKH